MQRRDELHGLLESLGDLGESELLALGVAPAPEEEQSLQQARKKAAQVADFRGRTRELEKLQGEVVAWSTVEGSRSALYVPGTAVVGGSLLADLRAVALQAVMDAVTASFLEGDLDPQTQATLRSRWDSVVA